MNYKEEFERNMAFISDQQARFAVGMQEVRERHAETEAIVARLAYATLEGFKDTNAKINALVDSQIGYEDRLQRLQDVIEELGLKVISRLSRPDSN
ncbi:MAG TPA: hypothetical protein VM941_09270 [Pyrinomonadaceae bacterium]|jgi:hypothetical protein|nr:hypothetical protein [Pyrinomonadaceae bacterium]